MIIYKLKFEPSWKLMRNRNHTGLTTLQEENTFELLHLLLVINALKIFVSMRMKCASYTYNFPSNKRVVVVFTIFRYARELYKFIEVIGACRKTDHNTLAPIETLHKN